MIPIHQISISYFQLPAGYVITSNATWHSSPIDTMFVLLGCEFHSYVIYRSPRNYPANPEQGCWGNRCTPTFNDTVMEEINCMNLKGSQGRWPYKTTMKEGTGGIKNRFKRRGFCTYHWGGCVCVSTFTYTPQMCWGGFGALQVCASATDAGQIVWCIKSHGCYLICLNYCPSRQCYLEKTEDWDEGQRTPLVPRVGWSSGHSVQPAPYFALTTLVFSSRESPPRVEWIGSPPGAGAGVSGGPYPTLQTPRAELFWRCWFQASACWVSQRASFRLGEDRGELEGDFANGRGGAAWAVRLTWKSLEADQADQGGFLLEGLAKAKKWGEAEWAGKPGTVTATCVLLMPLEVGEKGQQLVQLQRSWAKLERRLGKQKRMGERKLLGSCQLRGESDWIFGSCADLEHTHCLMSPACPYLHQSTHPWERDSTP